MTFDLKTSGLTRSDAAFFLAVLKRKPAQGFVDHADVLAIRPDMTLWQAHAVLERMCELGFLRPRDKMGKDYASTSKAQSLLRSDLKPRFSAKQIEKDLARLIANARAFNRDREYPVVVSSIKLFGSALFDRPDYGGLDVEIFYERRQLTAEQRAIEYKALPRREKSECYDAHCTEVIIGQYAERRARRLLCKGVKSVSTAAPGTIEGIAPDWKEVFAYSVIEEKEVMPEGVLHPRDVQTQREVFGEEAPHTPRPIRYKQTRMAEPPSAGLIPTILKGSFQVANSRRQNLGDGLIEDDAELCDIQSDVDRYIAFMASERAPGWELPKTDTFSRVRTIWQRGVDNGFLADAPIELIINPWRVDCVLTLKGKNPKTGKRMRIIFSVLDGPQCREMSFPIRETEQNRFERAEFYAQIEMTIARSMCMPMFEMLEAANIPGGATVCLSVFWHPSEPAPVIPNLAPLCKRVVARAKALEFSRPAMDAGVRLALAKEDPFDREISASASMYAVAEGEAGQEFPKVTVKCETKLRVGPKHIPNIGISSQDGIQEELPAAELLHEWHDGLRNWKLTVHAEREASVWLAEVRGPSDTRGIAEAITESKIKIIQPEGADVIDFCTASQRRRGTVNTFA